MHSKMNKYIRYFSVFLALLFVSCVNMTEGLDEREVIVVDTEEIEIDSDGGEKSIKVNAHCNWEMESTEQWSWITPTLKKGNIGESNLKLIIQDNLSIEERTAIITIKNSTYGIVREIPVLQKAGTPYIHFSKDKIEAASVGIQEKILLKSNVDYTISSSEEWCKVSTLSGKTGEMELTVTVDPSVSSKERSAVLSFNSPDHKYSTTLEVLQNQFKPELNISESLIETTDEGCSKSISVTSNIRWEAKCTADWIILSKVNGNDGVSTIIVTVKKNNTIESRTANIVIFNNDYNVVKEIKVSQLPFTATLDVSDSEISVTEAGIIKNITITSNVSWTAVCNADWVTLSSVEGISGSSRIKITVDENTGTEARSTKIVVSSTKYGISKEIILNQLPLEPSIEISETEISTTEDGCSKGITITSNVAWEAKCQADWVTLSNVNGKDGVSTLNVTVKKNGTLLSRSAKITVSNGEYGIVKEITVKQLSFVTSLVVSDTEISTTEEGVSKNITITSNISWTAVCDAGWVTLSSVNGSKGTSTVNVTVSENPNTEARSTRIIVSNSEYGISKEIAVNQSALDPKLTVSDTEISATESGISKDITVASNVSWTAVCDAEWVNLSPVNGTKGTSTVKITVNENTSVEARSTKVVVSSGKYGIVREITITQSPLVPKLEVSETAISTALSGGSRNIRISSNIPWIASCAAEWIELSEISGGSGESTIIVSVSQNATTSSRNAVINIRNSDYDIQKSINVTQVAFVPELIVSNSTVSAKADGEIKNVTVTSNVEWEAVCDEDWVSLSPVNSSAGTQTLSINVDQNRSTSVRTAVVTVRNHEYSLVKEIAVAQAAFVPELTLINGNTLNVDYASGSRFIGVRANVEYQVSTTSDWIEVDKVTDGVNLIYEMNDGTSSSRTAEIVFTCADYSDLQTVLTVTQSGFSADNIIRFTSSDGLMFPTTDVGFGANIISVTAVNDIYEIRFDGPVTAIPDDAFKSCGQLTSVILPPNVASIGDYAFYGCTSLESITFTGSVSEIGSHAFYDCSSLVELIVPESVTQIGSHAFYRCKKLRNFDIPDGLTSISDYMFYECSALEEIVLPLSITSIGSYAFYKCSSIDEIIIPKNVSSIGSYAFAYCSSLKSVICLRTTPPGGSNQMFSSNASNRKIYVPQGHTSTYKSTSYWSSYSSYIYDLDYTPTECLSLSITALDIEYDETSTIITYSAMTNGSTIFGPLENIEVSGSFRSNTFPENTTYEDIVRTVSYTYMGHTATATFIHKGIPLKSYDVVLNNSWMMSTSVSNPDSSMYEGVYESYSNYHVDNASATMYIDIEGYNSFTFYVRSHAETTYDYVVVYELDSTTQTKMSTNGKQNSGTSISSYTKVTYTNISTGPHRIKITYKKDSSQSSGTDRGYVLIPKNQ